MRLAGYHGALHRPVVQALLHTSSQPCLPSQSIRQSHQLLPLPELRSTPNPKAKNVAVLGGGLTGLTTAYQLSRTIPHAKVTIFEKQDRLGGWVDSEVVKVDGGEVLFEWGPRTIRPDQSGAGLATLMLIVQLGIHDQVIGIGKDSPAATSRYVYYPDHLVRMPGPYPSTSFIPNIVRNLYTVFTEPIYDGVVAGMIREPSVRPRSSQIADESLGGFLQRRFGSRLTENLASAVIHGIYAGDIHDLSARTLMPSLWYAETRDPDGNGIIAEFADLAFKKQYLRNYSDVFFQNLVVTAKDVPKDSPITDAFINSFGRQASVYTFGRGTGLIAQRLNKVLAENPNVTIKTSTAIDKLEYDMTEMKIKLGSNTSSVIDDTFDYVVSTLSPAHLKQQLASVHQHSNDSASVSALEQQLDRTSESVNVMVVNLYYSNPDLLSVQGFGYLIPQSVPADQNPERALGVIFGSETSGIRGPNAIQNVPKPTKDEIKMLETEIDTLKERLSKIADHNNLRVRTETTLKMVEESYAKALEELETPVERQIHRGQDTANGTKLTVMLGGHWWKDWNDTDLPTEDQAVEMARAVLARHLSITDAPLAAKARLNRNCIPQYRPGYRKSMAAIHKEVLDGFQGRLKLAGTWWQGGVGINDCIRKARLTAFSIREDWETTTGLEEYCKKEQFVIGDVSTHQVVMDPLQSS